MTLVSAGEGRPGSSSRVLQPRTRVGPIFRFGTCIAGQVGRLTGRRPMPQDLRMEVVDGIVRAEVLEHSTWRMRSCSSSGFWSTLGTTASIGCSSTPAQLKVTSPPPPVSISAPSWRRRGPRRSGSPWSARRTRCGPIGSWNPSPSIAVSLRRWRLTWERPPSGSNGITRQPGDSRKIRRRRRGSSHGADRDQVTEARHPRAGEGDERLRRGAMGRAIVTPQAWASVW